MRSNTRHQTASQTASQPASEKKQPKKKLTIEDNKPLSITVNPNATEYSYLLFSRDKLKIGKIEVKDLPEDASSKGTYTTFKIEYDYGTPEEADIRPFQLEGPLESFPFGINRLEDKSTGKIAYSYGSVIDPRREDHAKYIAVLLEVYNAIVLFCVENRQKLGMESTLGLLVQLQQIPQFDMERLAPNIKCPLNLRKDKEKKIMKNRPPMLYSKIQPFGKSRAMITDFGDPPQEVDHDIIQAAEIHGFPLRDMSSVYVGGPGPSASIQIFFKSMVVDHLTTRSRVHEQGKTIQKLNAKNADKKGILDAQIAAIKKSLEEQKLKSNTTPLSTISDSSRDTSTNNVLDHDAEDAQAQPNIKSQYDPHTDTTHNQSNVQSLSYSQPQQHSQQQQQQQDDKSSQQHLYQPSQDQWNQPPYQQPPQQQPPHQQPPQQPNQWNQYQPNQWNQYQPEGTSFTAPQQTSSPMKSVLQTPYIQPSPGSSRGGFPQSQASVNRFGNVQTF